MQRILSILFICFALHFNAQIINTIAGNGSAGPPNGNGGQAVNATIHGPYGLAIDTLGNIFVSQPGWCVVRKIDTSGVISAYAGNGNQGYNGDGIQATSATLTNPGALAFDKSGNLYVSDCNSFRIRKIDANGIISTVVGNGSFGNSGDGGPATAASIGYNITGIALDKDGNLFISDNGNQVIRKIDVSGIITTVAGNGTSGYSGDGGLAINAQLNYPMGITCDTIGNLYIGDMNNGRVRKVDLQGNISTYAGNGTGFYPGDGLNALNVGFNSVNSLCFDKLGNLIIGGGYVVYKMNPAGIVTTYAGNGTYGFSGDGGLSTVAMLNGGNICIDKYGDLYYGDYSNNRIRKITHCNSPITLNIAGSNYYCQGQASTVLTVSGASTYSWSANAWGATTNTVAVNPPSPNATYSVMGIDGNNCADTAKIKVKSIPSQIKINGSQGSPYIVCNGNPAYLHIKGATSYTWMPGNLTGDSIPNPTVNTTYTITSDSGNCQFIHFVDVQLDTTCFYGIKESPKEDILINVYPNPTTGFLIMETQNKVAQLKMTNLIGEEITNLPIKPQESKTEIDLSAVPNGIYFVKVKTEEGETTQKIIVQH